jgi:hypothetical protein
MPVDWSMLPNDIVRMVLQYDRSDRKRMHRLKDDVVCELHDMFYAITRACCNRRGFYGDMEGWEAHYAWIEAEDWVDARGISPSWCTWVSRADRSKWREFCVDGERLLVLEPEPAWSEDEF